MGLLLLFISIANCIIFVIMPASIVAIIVSVNFSGKQQKVIFSYVQLIALFLCAFVFGWSIMKMDFNYEERIHDDVPDVVLMNIKKSVIVYKEFDLLHPVFEMNPEDECRGFLNEYFLSVNPMEMFSDKYLVFCKGKGVGWVERSDAMANMPYSLEHLLIKCFVFSLFLILSYFGFCLFLSIGDYIQEKYSEESK